MGDPRETRASVDSSAWDGDAAMSGCASSGDPAAAYAAICAGKKDGDPAKQSSWALPHHKHPGDPPNSAGVSNALSRLPQTKGLTNEAAAKAHLQAHMKAINPDYVASGAPSMAQVRASRAQALAGNRRSLPGGAARMEPFRAFYKREAVVINGKELAALDGYASITGIDYEMWDLFGPYTESVSPDAFDATLAAAPDVAFLMNHRGMTMARTVARPGSSPTLLLDADPRGLHSRAYLNPERSDIADLLTAIDDGLITEMSFAFMITAGGWDDDYEHFTIEAVDLNRGDVSAVNYGANPYTSIEARAREVMADLAHLPDGAQRAAWMRLTERFGAAAARRAAGDAGGDDDVTALVASLDATLDQASLLAQGISRTGLDADTCQALDLITAAEAIADELMELLGIYDPDDPSGENAAAAKPHRGQVTGTRYADVTGDELIIPDGAAVEHVTRKLGDENGRSIEFYEQMLRL